jgi:hypothetical protein
MRKGCGGLSKLCISTLLLALAAAAQVDPLNQRLAPRRGDYCFLCNEALASSDIVYQVDGQRLGVHKEKCDAALRSDPRRWIARLKSRGAFLGAVTHRQALSPAWFAAGLYVLIGLVFAGLCAHRAFHTGHNPARWFFAGLALNAVGYLLLLLRPARATAASVPSGLRKIAATSAPAPCPACGSTNHPSARQCLSCGTALQPAVAAEVERC